MIRNCHDSLTNLRTRSKTPSKFAHGSYHHQQKYGPLFTSDIRKKRRSRASCPLSMAWSSVTAHLALDLVGEKRAESILNYCEKHLDEDIQ